MLEAMHFSGTWRDYQQRVLDEFDHHLADDRINIVAAPGSGKTVLGLELVRRLGRPAIVLAPSLTIRDQWAARLVPLFMANRPDESFVSFSLEAPATITCATYQALHAIHADSGKDRIEILLAWARANAPVTLVLDEAHHLRQEWWRALDMLIEELGDAKVVSLTATPPYDAPLAEWRRFESACGPIDLEIGIPELVRNGDLCPHQDHVVLSRPSDDLLALLDARREAVSDIVQMIRADATLADGIENHPWLLRPLDHLEPILDNPTILSSMLVHLHAIGRELPKDALRLLGVDVKSVPMQTARWFEALLNALLYDLGETSPLDVGARRVLINRLHRSGLIEGDRVKLGETKRIVRMMAGDRVKLTSIAVIAEAEARQCRNELRMLVLADHVRGADLPNRPSAKFEPAKIGVATIFETLRRKDLPGQSIGVLTGTLVILPVRASDALTNLGADRGIPRDELNTRALPHCITHRIVTASGNGKRALVGLVTELFQRGDITVLVGTQALLGEGWDAPAINSLVLASNSASYMLSNQMRGRAIRIDPHRPGKVSNIWHLATLTDPSAIGSMGRLVENLEWGGIADGAAVTADIKLLERRFDAYAGISNDGTMRIGTGLARLALADHETLQAANAATFARAADRAGIARDWATSLGDAPSRAHVREVAAPRHTPRRLVWRNTINSVVTSGLASGAMAGSYGLLNSLGTKPFLVLLTGVATTATIATLPRLARALYLALRNGSLENSLRQVGEMVLVGLRNAGFLDHQEYSDAQVLVAAGLDGSRTLCFDGLSRNADILAMDAVVELLGPIQNPRYLLVRKGGLIRDGKDYHAIPAVFSKNKAAAESFAREWSARVGPCKALATRSEEGRQALLLARRASLAAGMQRAVERRSDWR
ncbi:DEAD/DEAH box helicase family protein [Erythrobacter mangrovi]|uniref:DEAD/DEAH box helicase family protein n=1 Tax=Erythrobacter mangrovi TaxID=2739433 RepID=A0A7D4CBH3_9SPHN|nr:DEAD/DEAH box helicase family protein [Erythrobacter mangrovi]QKG69969.1 DEAD/DEAH box helicase family protein [Erythrobacter mangrovi]